MKKSGKVLLIIAACLVSAGIFMIGASLFMGVSLTEPISVSHDFIPLVVTQSEIVVSKSETEVLQDDSITSDQIRSLNISWTSGDVIILVTDDEKIGLSESSAAVLEDNFKMVKTVQGNELIIQYMDKQIILGSVPSKTLTVHLPKSYAEEMQTIKVSTASADLTVSGVVADKLIFDSASGNLEATDMVLNYLNADTTSGYITVSGSLAGFRCDYTSGNVQIVQNNSNCRAEVETTSGVITLSGAYSEADLDTTSGDVAISSFSALRELEIETTSGNVTLTVPSGSAFELEFDTGSGKFISDLPVSFRGDSYVFNKGGPEFEVSTASGSLTVLPYVEK